MSRRAARESERGAATDRDLRDALDRSQDPTADVNAPAPAGLPEPVDHVTTTLPQVGGYRMRDFSPEGRRGPGTLPTQSAATDDGAPLNYRTQAAAPIVSSVPSALRSDSVSGQPRTERPAQPVQPAQRNEQASEDLDAPERTMTRRELRALREAQAAAENSAPPQLIEPLKPASAGLGAPLRLPTPAAQPAQPIQPAQPTQPAQPIQSTVPLQPATPVTPAAAAQAPVPLVQAATPLVQAATPLVQPATPLVHAEPKPTGFPHAAPTSAQAPKLPVAESLVSQPEPAVQQAPVPFVQRPAAVPQTPVPDFDSLIAHDGSSSHYAPSALVLPSIPTHSDLPRALDGTGEILITGSMDLPRGYGTSTAEHSGLDGIEVDRLLDDEDRLLSPTNSTPVRASRAVSTHTATRGMIQTKRPSNGNKMLAVLAITASALAVVVVGLVVVGFVTGIF